MDSIVPVKGIVTKDGELIPIWDNRIKFIDHELYGNTITVKDDYNKYFQLSDLMYDLKTKKLSLGEDINYYERPSLYKIGTPVYYSEKIVGGPLTESTIKEIKYVKFDIEPYKGRSLLEDNKYILEQEQNKNIVVQENITYNVKKWRPWFVMEDGAIIKYDSMIYLKKVKK